MDPIISPTWIYLIHVTNAIYSLSFIVLVISIFALLLLGVKFVVDDDLDLEREKMLTTKGAKICVISIILCTLILVLVPDKKTMYGMIAASMITPDNISGVEEHVIDLATKIADAVCNATK